ncbi:MAG: hypothetical protein KTV77_01265 [Wolbachia endosymbiont of Fragariocoptes setiger]|nr:hypothetical protein [Wolbachia endosymbiont of Fragariocoptes setiger]
MQEKFNNVKNAARVVNNSLKEKVSFIKDQSDIKKLKEALASPCFKIGDKTFDKRTIEEAIKFKEERYKSNRIKIEKFSHGKADKELVEEIKTSMGKLKQEIAKLEFTVRSIEKGKAPAPPVQTNIIEQPSKTTPLSSKDYIQHLDTLAGYVGQAGVYEGYIKST